MYMFTYSVVLDKSGLPVPEEPDEIDQSCTTLENLEHLFLLLTFSAYAA
jgi:hypothetical protein